MNRSFNNLYPSTSPTAPRMAVAPGTEWEDLRKQARQYENEIDTKLMSFSKLCSNYVAHDQTNTSTTSSSSSSFETVSMEIEQLLERLSDINQRMSDVVPSLLGTSSAASHTLQRHHEILQDYRREFERTKANIRNFQNREDLLIHKTSSNPDLTSAGTTGLSSRRQDYYLREMAHLNNSHKIMDANLELAGMIRKDLSDQKRYFLDITTKVNALANRFPLVNNILQKIKMKKRKDSLVLGGVIAICLFILFLYMLR